MSYWNDSVAANAGVAVKAADACKSGAKTCGGLIGGQCPKGTYCNYSLTSSGMCGALDLSGVCWGVPAKCPSVLIGPNTRQCGAKVCASECELIKKQAYYYTDSTCVQ